MTSTELLSLGVAVKDFSEININKLSILRNIILATSLSNTRQKELQCQNKKMTLAKNKESSIKTPIKKDSSDQRKWYSVVFTLVIVATVATRFYKVTEPDHVW